MSVTLTSPANGDTLSGSVFEAETKDLENWLNGGIVAADIQAASLRRTHLYKPDSDGFPSERSHEIQTALVNRVIRDHWDPRQQSNRFDVLRPMIGQDNVVPIGPGCSATFEHYGGSKYAKVACWFGVKVYPNSPLTTTPPLSERLRGTVVLKMRAPGGTITTFAQSTRQIEPGWVGYDFDAIGVGMATITAGSRLRGAARYTQAYFTMNTTGTHDFWLEYVYDTTNNTDFRVVAFCQRGLKISVHKV